MKHKSITSHTDRQTSTCHLLTKMNEPQLMGRLPSTIGLSESYLLPPTSGTKRQRTSKRSPFCSYNTKFQNPLLQATIVLSLPISFFSLRFVYIRVWWAGSSVVIVTGYGLDGPGSNPGGDEIFRPFRPALGPTQPPLQYVTSLSRG